MFSKNDTIIFGNYGVCKITEIQDMEFDKEVRPYYILRPVFENNSTLYLPVGNEKVEEKMFRTLSTEEVYSLIKTMPDEDTIWVENDNARKGQYKEILAGKDRLAIVKLIKTLYLHRDSLKEKGRKLHVADEQFLKDAEKILYDEFAHVLNIKREEVLPFIFEELEATSGNKQGEKIV